MMKWESAFRVVAHELRSPAGVISGYARMLQSGRLDETGRLEALKQLERAAGRLGDLAQQSSELAEWLHPHDEGAEQVHPIIAIVGRAALASAAPGRVRIVDDPATTECQVRTREPRALAAAIASVMDATSREMETRGAEIGVAIRRNAAGGCDVLIAPASVIATIQMDDAHGSEQRFNFESGGLGLHLILGAVVLHAHGATLWASADRRGITGIRIPVTAGH